MGEMFWIVRFLLVCYAIFLLWVRMCVSVLACRGWGFGLLYAVCLAGIRDGGRDGIQYVMIYNGLVAVCAVGLFEALCIYSRWCLVCIRVDIYFNTKHHRLTEAAKLCFHNITKSMPLGLL